MTATEVLQRQEEKMRLMGPMVGRLQSELLGPMIDRVFNVLMRRGQLPMAPTEFEGQQLAIDYVTPVARAQKAQLVFNLSRFLEQMVPLANLKPEMLDNLDFDATFRWAHSTLDAPVMTLANQEKMQQERQVRQQQQQAMMEQEQANAQAAQIKDLGAANQSLSNAAG